MKSDEHKNVNFTDLNSNVNVFLILTLFSHETPFLITYVSKTHGIFIRIGLTIASKVPAK